MAGEEHLHTRGDHTERTARITRCKCASSKSTPARTTTSPVAISITAPAKPPPHPRNASAASDNAARPEHHGARQTDATGECRSAGDRRDARARLQRLCHDLRFELARRASAKLPRPSLKTAGDRFDHMEGLSSRTRRRHRSSHRLTSSAADTRSIPTPSAESLCRLRYDESEILPPKNPSTCLTGPDGE